MINERIARYYSNEHFICAKYIARNIFFLGKEKRNSDEKDSTTGKAYSSKSQSRASPVQFLTVRTLRISGSSAPPFLENQSSCESGTSALRTMLRFHLMIHVPDDREGFTRFYH